MSTAPDAWVEHVAGFTKPARILWCTGEPAELEAIGREAYADPDGAEKPELTMSARRPEDVGGGFLTRAQATQRYWEPFWGGMGGRVMYVVPYELATGTPLAEAGVQITDDPRLVVDLARSVHVDPSVRRAPARATVAGFVPKVEALDRTGLEIDDESWRGLFDVEPGAWRAEIGSHEQALAQLGRGLPMELRRAHALFAGRVDEIASRQARAEEGSRT
jgi:GTP-dependent phosphoenolpyruvate carboxykinase